MLPYYVLGILGATATVAYVAHRQSANAAVEGEGLPTETITLDKGLTLDESRAVSYALEKESNKVNLDAFGTTFEPNYPTAAGLLHGKAKVSDTTGPLAVAIENGVKTSPLKRLGVPIQPSAHEPKQRALQWAGKPFEFQANDEVIAKVANVAKPKVIIKTLGKRKAAMPAEPNHGDKAAPLLPPAEDFATWSDDLRARIPMRWSGDFLKLAEKWGPQTVVSTTPFGTFRDVQRPPPLQPGEHANQYATMNLQGDLWTITDRVMSLQDFGLQEAINGKLWGGGNPFDAGGMLQLSKLVAEEMKKVGAQIGPILKLLAPIVGLIPGIGSGIAVALSVAGSLAMGQNISDAMLDAVANAIPGAGIAKVVIDSAISAGKGILDGKRLDRVAIETTRREVEREYGPVAAAAFDAGVAVAQGKNLQDAGFQVYYGWCKGNDLAEKAGHFTEKAAKAVESGKNVKDVLIDAAKDELVSAVESSIQRALSLDNVINQLSKDPEALKASIEETSKKLHVAQEIVQAAYMCVKDMGNGIVLVDPEIRKRFDMIVVMPDKPIGMNATRRALEEATKIIPKGQPILKGVAQNTLDRIQRITQTKAQAEKILLSLAEQRAQWVKHYLDEMNAAAAA